MKSNLKLRKLKFDLVNHEEYFRDFNSSTRFRLFNVTTVPKPNEPDKQSARRKQNIGHTLMLRFVSNNEAQRVYLQKKTSHIEFSLNVTDDKIRNAGLRRLLPIGSLVPDR